MALVNNGIAVSIAQALLPTGYVKPVVPVFANHDYIETVDFDGYLVGKIGVDDADPIVTFTALVADLVSQIGTEITADYDVATLTVTVYGELLDVSTDLVLGESLYTNDALNYKPKMKIYIKAE